MTENKFECRTRQIRKVICLILVGMYLVGLVMMIAAAFQMGLILWVVSTLGGIALLFWMRAMEKRAADAKAAAEGRPIGESVDDSQHAGDGPCE